MSIITGVNVPHISARDIKAFRFRLPPVENQRRIAAILSAYDDLIGNNTRRIAILEEMARRLYEEWFVHFRFPGHEGVKLVESEIGPVPEGWEISRLAELAEIVMGQSPKSEFYNETGEGLPFHQGVTNFGDFFPTDRLYCTVENRIAESGDILFSVRAPVGRINIATRKMVIGRGLSAIRSKSSHQTFLLCQLRSKFSEEDMMGGGTIFKAVTKKDMHDVQMVTPRDDHVGRFEGIAVPMWSLIKTLTEKNTNLRVQRALLLPKLISGEIDVCGIGEPIAEVAAE
jgi:type I restriction enzyme S subunit